MDLISGEKPISFQAQKKTISPDFWNKARANCLSILRIFLFFEADAVFF